MMRKKKKKGCGRGRSLAGLLPFFFFLQGHDIANCIVTQGLGGAQGCAVARHNTARRHHDTHGLAVGVSRDTNFVSWLGLPFVP